jgi:hypothetical protein
MFRFNSSACFVLLFLASTVFTAAGSGPKIEFDTKTFNCGTVIEGKTDKLNAVFIVKNTGDGILKLQSVRPGCGCTVVKYDSLVQPGKTVKIESQVTIAGYRSGSISKAVFVTSNALNEPSVTLTIEAKIRSVVDVNGAYVTLNGSDGKTPRAVYVTSRKTDLKISDVGFKSAENSETPGWQLLQPAPLKFAFTALDSTTTDSSRVYKLDIYFPGAEKSQTGNFIIKTNHPEKPELKIPGAINK